MSAIDLSIVSRGTAGSEWSAEKGKIDQAKLSEVSEDKTDNSSALNALPTPFARFFVVREAFRSADGKRTYSKLTKATNAIPDAAPASVWGYKGCAGKGGRTTNAVIPTAEQ